MLSVWYCIFLQLHGDGGHCCSLNEKERDPLDACAIRLSIQTINPAILLWELCHAPHYVKISLTSRFLAFAQNSLPPPLYCFILNNSSCLISKVVSSRSFPSYPWMCYLYFPLRTFISTINVCLIASISGWWIFWRQNTVLHTFVFSVLNTGAQEVGNPLNVPVLNESIKHFLLLFIVISDSTIFILPTEKEISELQRGHWQKTLQT